MSNLRRNFDLQLEEINEKFQTMGLQALDAVRKANTALINRDKELAQDVITSDVEINLLEESIEKQTTQVIALQQPVVYDLRLVIAVLKASSDLERIGDHAVSIAKRITDYRGRDRVGQIEEAIENMANTVSEIGKETVNAFVNQDEKAAIAIAKRDSEVDEAYHEIFKMVVKGLEEDDESIEAGLAYISIIANLERIGDYLTNICERTVYMVTGQNVELN
ncbi:hypothetical protein AWM75_05765 [Aerococcus urinaehominis]|uniref:Phosphate-specific transport system accessory protein PhoU n=1 Tax=Aerococcus urinaehominis TaxID=128944 RepID=A0A120IAY3_9LACT|nr:phosphate signaling complex protein PhoU [Aerococcus urinaehominis]AMB99533.1 hypothetical protein AWM75_05765 [Aerococcus urinaehominis]SDM34193.1 phosphate uptake regulator, PhoU [Aerococcus urinaehominis]